MPAANPVSGLHVPPVHRAALSSEPCGTWACSSSTISSASTIRKEGEFDALACTTHNYREFMSGFTDWAQTVADGQDAADYRSQVTDSESASMRQSLASPPGHKSGYCLAVCPAGEDNLGPYLDDRKTFMDTVLRPLQDKKETLYVLPGSPAQEHAQRRFPHKPTKEVTGGWQPPAKRATSS